MYLWKTYTAAKLEIFLLTDGAYSDIILDFLGNDTVKKCKALAFLVMRSV